MEEFRVCTVEAQAATEDIREEISTILSSFDVQHQKVYSYITHITLLIYLV